MTRPRPRRRVRAPPHAWHRFAARARVLLVNTALVPPADRPRSILDLADPKWRGRAGIAKPLFGTTATHAACLYVAWGELRAMQFFCDLKANDVQILSGNKRVAEAVGGGQLAFGLTDTDDAVAEIDKAMPVVIVYPDQGEGALGTLVIPNTICILKRSPHPDAARRLVDYLLSEAVESKLAAGASAQIPLREGLPPCARLGLPPSLRVMEADFDAAAAQWEAASARLRDEFCGAPISAAAHDISTVERTNPQSPRRTMMNRLLVIVWAALVWAVAGGMATAAEPRGDAAKVRALFANPPREYASAPLWVWNDQLTEEQVRGTLRDLAAQKVKQAFVHPRPGLMTPYLSDEWFRLWKAALDEAEKLDMNLWIYDENSYPSGFAGGWVPELMPESRGRGLVVAEEKAPRAAGDVVLAAYRVEGEKIEHVAKAGSAGAPGHRGRQRAPRRQFAVAR